MKILLVDDEREEREGISFLIRKYQYPLEVVQARNGKEALDILEHQEIDILFTDVRMPVMSGLELVRIVRERQKQIKIVIFSAYAEFEYAKQAVEMNALRYLLKPIDINEFRALMDDILLSLKQEQQKNKMTRCDWLFKLFTGAKLNPESEAQLCHALFSSCEGSCRFLNIEFVNNYFIENENLFLYIVQKYFGDKTEYVTVYPNEAYVLLLESARNQGKQFSEQLQVLTNEIQRTANAEWRLLVSPLFETLDELKQCVEQADSEKADLFGYRNCIVEIGQHHEKTEHYASSIETLRNQLLSTLDFQNAEIIRKLNGQLMQAILAEQKISKLYVQNTLYAIVQSMREKLAGIETEEVFSGANAIFKAKNPKTILQEYEKIVDRMLVSLQIDHDQTDIVQCIKRIVQREYRKDISLNDIAEQVHLTPGYVSYVFKQKSGQSLVKYITDVKMEKARKLLEEKDMKIVQVGKSCGYENPSYFNRLFKNYYGVTPKQYRERR